MTTYAGLPPPSGERPNHKPNRAREYWNLVRIRHMELWPASDAVRELIRVRIVVHLGALAPADVRVEATSVDTRSAEPWQHEAEWPIRLSAMQSYRNGSYVFEALLPAALCDQLSALAVRILPSSAAELGECPPIAQTFPMSGP